MQPGKHEYKCFIVDDNQIDRLSVAAHVKKYPFLKMVGLFSSAEEAIEAAPAKNPDVLFLDIDMPGISGLELRKELSMVPACVFISSYPEFAIDSFSVNALDFLVKPIKSDRFEASMQRLQYFLDIHSKADSLDHSLNEESLFIKDGHEKVRIQFYDIMYLEALKDYTGIITKQKKYCVLTPLGNLLKEKAFSGFIRVHRSYAVQKRFVRNVTPKSVTVNEVLLPVGRSYKDALQTLLNL